jgi:Skp family chaperone for outer membrane proteins
MPSQKLGSSLAALAALAMVGFVGWRAGAENVGRAVEARAPVSIALVNVRETINGLDELEAENQKLRQRVENRQKDLNELGKQLEEINEELKILPANDTENRRRLVARGTELREVFNARANVYQRLIEIEEGDIMRALYTKLQAAVAEVASKEGFDLVIFDDRIIELPKAEERGVNAAIQDKLILFAADGLDISDRVITLMNSKYQAGLR